MDLVVTDVGLPGGMNDRPMAEAGLALRPGLTVLRINGSAEAILGTVPLPAGMQGMTKPFATEVLAARVRTLAGPGRAPSA